jgi:biotin carboxyl carrier protein
MEKKFRITVDGREYSVTVEDLSEGGGYMYPSPGSMAVPAPPVPAPLAAAAPLSREPAGPGDVCSTLGGVVDSLAVAVGQAVNRGDKVATIEAMKMKAPMIAPRSGNVTSIAVKVGEAVEAGQVLLTIS